VKYIESLAELKGGSAAVDMGTAESVANQILNMSNKNNDGVITEKEFIKW
jgi:Ca2+-binding EF-hand superfamily protein